MTNEKITPEKFLELLKAREDKFLKHYENGDRNYPAVCGLYTAWMEIMAKEIPTEMAAALNMITIRYFIIERSENQKVEIVGRQEGFVGKDIALWFLEREREKRGFPNNLDLTSKIIFES